LNHSYDISPEEFEQIEQFLNNEMPSDQAAIFAERLQSDLILQQKLEEVKLLTLGVSEAVLKNKLESFHEAINTNSSKKNGKVISIGKRLLAAAAVLAIIGLSAWWFFLRENKLEKIYSNYYKPDPGLITAMGPSDNYTFEKAMVDYKNGDYDKAIEAWSSLSKDQPRNDTLNYFLGAAYQANGKNKEAITLLEKATANKNNTFYKDACWYLGLAYLKEENTEKAREYIQLSGHPESINLLDALNKK